MIGAPLSILCVAARPARKKALRTRGRCSFPAGRTCGTIRTFMPTLLKGLIGGCGPARPEGAQTSMTVKGDVSSTSSSSCFGGR